MRKVIVFLSVIVIITFCISNFEILEANNIDEVIKTVTEPITELYSYITEFMGNDMVPHEYQGEETSIFLDEEITTAPTEETTVVYTEETTVLEYYEESTIESYDKSADDYNYSNYYGRLYIPSVGIDVALYYECSQEVVDMEDGAAIFDREGYEGLIIGDHNYQGFSKLSNISSGSTGYIKLADGEILNIQCIEYAQGHNTKSEITYTDGTIVSSGYDFLMYTCQYGWQNIGIWKWVTF
jgi:hypothetical protein